MEVVIITGLSGAGKTKAADWFEDKGYYCIDNMPPALIRNFIDLSLAGQREVKKAAFVIDIRGGQFFSDLKSSVAALETDENVDFKILFIEASDEALIRRYNETRRLHPLTAATTQAAIAAEREQLSELRAYAHYIVDTTTLKVADMNAELEKLFSKDGVCGFISPTICSPVIGAFKPTTPVPKNGSIHFDCGVIPDRNIRSLIQGTSLVLIPCDLIGGTKIAILLQFIKKFFLFLLICFYDLSCCFFQYTNSA